MYLDPPAFLLSLITIKFWEINVQRGDMDYWKSEFPTSEEEKWREGRNYCNKKAISLEDE